MMNLYRENKVNPFSGFLFLLIQLPILFALYKVILGIFSPDISALLYPFVSAPGSINPMFLGLINIQARSILIVILAAVLQYFQIRMSIPKTEGAPSQAERMNKNMAFIGPILTVVFFINFPAAISIYWLTSSIFSIVQQIIVNKQLNNG
jgi:YidC/Oxa1 family membrane protein insertase